MGDWMTVSMRGTLAPEEVPAAETFLTLLPDWSNFGPLSYGPGLCGLGRWAQPLIEADGNVAERDYSPEDVAETLTELVAVCPSLRLKVHYGGSYESTACVATVTVLDGAVTVGAPEVAVLPGVDTGLAMARLMALLSGGGDTDASA